MKTIYVVIGSEGHYENHEEWQVCAYEDEVMACEHAHLADDWDEKLEEKHERGELDYGAQISHPYDPEKTHLYSGGTGYEVKKITLRDKLPNEE